MTIRYFAGLILCAFPLFATAQDNAVQDGVTLLRQEQYQKALQQFLTIEQSQPGNYLVENLIGITETKLDRTEEANGHYQQAIKLNPDISGPYKNLGFNYLNARQYQLAESQFKKALAIDPKDPFVHYYLATLYLTIDRDQDAYDQLGLIGSTLDNDPDTAFLMAKACFRLSHVSDGLKLIRSLEDRSALSISQEYELALILNEKQQYGECVKRFQYIAKMQPSWVSRYNLAIALFDNNQPDEAMPLLEALSRERPEDANVLSLLGAAYELDNKLPQALDAYEKAVRTDPKNSDHYLDYTRLLMNLDRYDEAAQLIQQRIKQNDNDYALNLRLGAIQTMQGAYAKARESFRRGIVEQPEVAVGYVGLAQTYIKEGNDQEAAKVLADARAKLPKDFALEYVYGLVVWRLGKDEIAIESLENAAKLAPNMIEPHYELGKIYMQKGNLADARAEFERVLQLDPEHANTHYQLSRIYEQLGDSAKSREMAQQTEQLMLKQREQVLTAQRSRISAFKSVSPQ